MIIDAATRNTAEYERVYGDRLYDVSSVYDHIVRIRQRYLDDITAPVLDHGFGNGVISAYLAREGFEVYGVETSETAVRTAKERAGELEIEADRFVRFGGYPEPLPYADETFGAVLSNQVLYFIPDREAIEGTLRDFARVLQPGGKLVCTVMAEDNYYFTEYGEQPLPATGPVEVTIRGRIDRDFELFRFRDEDDLASTVVEAGFAIDDLGYFDFRLLDVKKAKHYIVLARRR